MQIRKRLLPTLSLLALAGLAQAGTPDISFDIEAQPLGAALNAFAARTGLQVVLFADVSRDITASKVEGTFSPDAALERLLARTGLAFEYVNERTIAVRSTKPEAAAERDATVRPEGAEGALLLSQADTGAPGPALVPAGPDDGLAEILVTAQKRTESLIDVPISMSVLDAKEIEARRVQTTEDYILTIPNATFTRESSANPRVSLRGMSAGLDGGKFEPVAVTVDEISFGATNTGAILYANAFDIERIEVLRGPQGTLSGSNSLGGTINIITAKPDPRAFELKGTLDLSRYDTMLAKGVVNSPLSETVAVRTAAYVEQSDGAIRNIGPAGGSSSSDHFGGRLALRWLPSDRITVDASFSYEEQNRGLDTTIGLDRYASPEEREAAIQRIADLGGDYFAVDFLEDVGTNGGVVRHDVAGSIDIKDWTGTLRATYALDEHTLDLLYGHHFWEIRDLTDNDNSEYATSDNGPTEIDPRDTRSDSVELRMTSTYDGPLNWVAGLTYVDEVFTGWGHFDMGDDQYAGNYSFEGIFSQYQSLQSRAAFANLFWDIGERLHLSAGGRYSIVKTRYGFGCCGEGPGIPLPPIPLDKAELNEFTPRVALNYDFGERVTAYVQYATGYRAGYGNPIPAIGQHDTSLGPFDVPAEVESEHVSNYELGIKGRFLGGRLDLAAALFHMDYDDLQAFGGEVLDIPGGEFFGFDINAGSAYSRGAELEAGVRITDAFQLRGSFGYVETNAEELAGGITDVDIPSVRPWTMALSALYERPFLGGTRAQFRADYIGQAQAYSEFAENPASELPKFGRLDLSVGVIKDRWSAMAYMENVNDEFYWVGTSGTSGLHGVRAAIIPRTFGLRLTMNMRE
jgi:iron complex outermembrane receptor protein